MPSIEPIGPFLVVIIDRIAVTSDREGQEDMVVINGQDHLVDFLNRGSSCSRLIPDLLLGQVPVKDTLRHAGHIPDDKLDGITSRLRHLKP